MKTLNILLIFLTFSTASNAQERGFPIIRNYNTKEYKGSPQVFCVLQDNRGIMYFGSGSSILEYDGISWRNIPNDKQKIYLDFAQDSNGRIYVSATDEIGYLSHDIKGNTFYKSITNLLPDSTVLDFVWTVRVTPKHVYFITYDAILQYSPNDEKFSVFRASSNDGFLDGFIFKDIFYAQSEKSGLFKIENNELIHAKQSEFFEDQNIFRTALPFDSTTVLVPTRTEGLYLYNTQKDIAPKPFPVADKSFLANNNIFTALALQNNYFVLGSVNKGALLLDKQGTILQRYQANNLQNNTIRAITQDENQIIWFGLDNGISKTENSLDLSYWDKNSGLKGSVYNVVRFNGTVYIATNIKLYFINKSNQVQEVKNIPVGHNWCFLEHKQYKSLLVGSRYGIYEIKGDKAIQIYEGTHAAKLYQSIKTPNRIFSSVLPDFISLRYEDGKWISEGKWEGVKDQVRGVIEDENGDLWLGTYRNGVIRVTPNYDNITKPTQIKYYTEKDGFANLSDILPFRFKNRIVFGSEKGLYVYNPKTDRFDPFGELGEQFCNGSRSVFSLKEMPDGKVWICPKENSKADIGYLQPNSKGAYDWVYVPFRRIPEMQIESFYIESSGIAWVGGSEGLYRYDMVNDTKNYEQPFKCLVRKVTSGNDSLLYGGNGGDLAFSPDSAAILSYKYNALKFEFAAPFFDSEEKTLYSFYLKGFDKEWSSWSRQAEKEYTNLHEGTYTFLVKARNVYDVQSEVSTYQFTILSPFYRTWWAYSLYLILLAFFIILIVIFYTHRLHLQKEQLELIVKEKTAKVVHQQEELKAFNEELFTTNEELYNQREELEATLQSLQDTQKQLVQSEKMASIGVLTAGIAHEINNPINFVYAGANSLMRDFIDVDKVLKLIKNIEESTLKPDEIVQQISNIKKEIDFDEAYCAINITLNDIMLGAQRTAEIVQGLRNFSRREEGEFEFSDINKIVERALVLLRNKYTHRVEIIKNLDPKLPDIECKVGKINQALMNIISNAIDAIIDKGKIEISTKAEGNMCSISVKDNGMGINEDALSKIFDPFYTTKKVGKGTGLGLSISYGIIVEHHGKIDVHSQVDKGTEFIITIPLKQKLFEKLKNHT